MTLLNWTSNPLKYILENIEFLILGIVTLIFVFISLVISSKMIYRGIKNKNKIIIYTGISYLGLGSCWFGVSFNFIYVLIFNTVPPWELHFLLHGGIVPFALFFWIVAMTELLMFREKIRQIIIIISAFLAVIIEVVYIIIIFTDLELLGTPVAPIQVEYGPFSYGYLSSLLIIFLFLGISFVRESIGASDPSIRLKGKYLGMSFLVFTFASFLEIFFKDIWIFIIARFIVMSSAFLFYIGFLK
jgi:hypothetical protein